MQSLSTAGRYGDARTWSKSYRRASSSMVLIAFPGPDLTDPLSLPFVDLLTLPTSPWPLAPIVRSERYGGRSHVILALGQHCPNRAGHFVGERDCRQHPRFPRQHAAQPASLWRPLS